jgi:antitoxin VapB
MATFTHLDICYTFVYIPVYTPHGGNIMDKAKLFKNGSSQAVRLPKQYSLPGQEVFVTKIDGIVMLIPKGKDPWQPFVDSLNKFSKDYLNFQRDQGTFDNRDAIE